MRKKYRNISWTKYPLSGGDVFYPFHIKKSKGEVLEFIGFWDVAKAMYEEMARQAELSGDSACLADVQNKLGWLLHKQGDEDNALKLLNQSLDYYRQKNDRNSLSAVKNKIGNIYNRLGEYKKAQECFESSLKLAEECCDRCNITMAMNNLGNNLGDQGQYHMALEYYQKGYDMDSLADDYLSASIEMGNMGWVYLLLGDHQKATDCWGNQVIYAKKYGDRHSLGIASGNLSAVYISQGLYKKAMEGTQLRIKIAREMGDKKGLCVGYGYLANIYKMETEYENADLAFVQAIDLAKEIGLKFYAAVYLFERGELFYEIGEIYKAEKYCSDSLEIALAINKKDTIFRCRLLQAKLAAVKDRAEGIRLIRGLLAEAGQPDQQAVINYELFKLTRDDQCRKEALELYTQLYEKTPDIDYKKKMEELERSN